MTPTSTPTGNADAPLPTPTAVPPEAPTEPPTDPLGLAVDAGPTGLADLETAPEPTLDTAPERSIALQAAKTDVALAAWRDESARRSQEFAERQAELAAALAVRRRKVMVASVVGASVAGLVLALGFGAFLAVTATGPVPVPPVGAAPVARVVAPIEAPIEAPVTATPVAAATPEVAPPPVVTAAPVVAAPPAVATTPPASGSGPLEEGPAVRAPRVETVHGYVWTEFATPSTGPVWLRWRDAAHREVLDRMACGGTFEGGERTCRAGRSLRRIAGAVAAGAAPGPWTVEACLGDACTPVGQFAVPANP